MCGVAVVALILAVRPFAEIGFLDDWSYVKTTEVFARTGHIVYNGWATAMLGWQVVWAALFVKLFGFSFTVVRMSMLPFVFGAVVLLHRCMVRFGISERNAGFGALAFGLSPMFVPFAPTFMTDVGGVFFILLCLYLCLRAVEAITPRATILWLFAAALTNVVGGSARQIVWLGALVMVPGAAWLLRRRRGVLTAAAALWIASLIAAFGMMRWFAAQPYSLPEKLLAHVGVYEVLAFLLHAAAAVPCLLLLVLPVAAAWLPYSRQLPRRAWIAVAIVLAVWALACVTLRHSNVLSSMIAPFLFPDLLDLGMDPYDSNLPGLRGVTLGMPSRVVISAFVLLCGLVILVWALWGRRVPASQANRTEGLDWKTLGWTVGVFAAAYFLLLVPRGLLAKQLVDRYLLGLTPLAILALLKLYEQQIGPRVPAISVVVLVLVGGYSLAATHDWFALERAHVAIDNEVLASGVPATQIQAGEEPDAWTEIGVTGYVNDARIRVPAGAYQPFHSVLDACAPIFTGWLPQIQPRFVIAHSPLSCLEPSDFQPVPYRTWLPPFRRQLIVEKVPEAMVKSETSQRR